MKKETVVTIVSDDKPTDETKYPVRPSKRSKYLARRRTGGIRFWDLGYYKVGDAFATIPFLDPHSTESIGHIIASSPLGIFDALTLSYYNQITDFIFSYPQTDWKNTFYQVDSTYQIYVDPFITYKGTNYVFSNTDVWDDSTFKPNGAEINDSFDVAIDNRLFTEFRINIDTHLKITSAFDYSSAAVSFVPSKHMDVFLVPNLIRPRLETQHDIILPIADYTIDTLDTLRVLYPREVFHDTDLDIYGYDLFANVAENYLWVTGGSVSYVPVYNITQYWKAHYGYRALRGVHTTFSGDTFSDLDPADYAASPQYPAPPSEPTYPDAATMLSEFIAQDPIEGALLAVIKKGGTYYYVWQSV